MAGSELQTWSTSWWSLVARGLLALGFGAVWLAVPTMSLTSAIISFGVYALADGGLALALAVKRPESQARRWPLAVQGLASTAVGLATVFRPLATASELALLVAAWAIITGSLELLSAGRLQQQGLESAKLLGLKGVVALGLGGLVAISPASAVRALPVLLGAYALAVGGLLLAGGSRLRRQLRHHTEPLAHG